MATERTSEVEAAFAEDGRLLGLRLDLIDEVGAYVRAPEPATLYRMHGCLTGAYDVQDLAVRSRVVVTNRAPSGLNRGFGGPQLYGALERTMHIAARRLGIDPAELARRNLVRAEQMPYRAAAGAVYDSGDYRACLDRVLELAGYDDLRAEHERDRQQLRRAELSARLLERSSFDEQYPRRYRDARRKHGQSRRQRHGRRRERRFDALFRHERKDAERARRRLRSSATA